MLHSAHCSFANQPICIALHNSTLGFFHPSNFQSYIIFRFLNQLNRTYENACKFGAKQITSFIKSRTHSQFNFYFFFWSLHLVLMKWISWIRFVSMVFAFLRFFLFNYKIMQWNTKNAVCKRLPGMQFVGNGARE